MYHNFINITPTVLFKLQCLIVQQMEPLVTVIIGIIIYWVAWRGCMEVRGCGNTGCWADARPLYYTRNYLLELRELIHKTGTVWVVMEKRFNPISIFHHCTNYWWIVPETQLNESYLLRISSTNVSEAKSNEYCKASPIPYACISAMKHTSY